MIAQVLFFNVFYEKDPHLNAVEQLLCKKIKFLLSKKTALVCLSIVPLDKELQWVNVKQKPFRQV